MKPALAPELFLLPQHPDKKEMGFCSEDGGAVYSLGICQYSARSSFVQISNRKNKLKLFLDLFVDGVLIILMERLYSPEFDTDPTELYAAVLDVT